MKTLLLTSALLFAATTAFAGNLNTTNDPVVAAPAATDWSGPYGGVTAGWQEAKIDVVGAPKNGSRSVEVPVLGITITEDELMAGGFAGYRHTYTNNITTGVELGVQMADHALYTAELQLGYDAGNLLPYVSGGYGYYNDKDGYVLGAGVDYKINESWFTGVKYTYGDFSTINTNSIGVRLGYRF